MAKRQANGDWSLACKLAGEYRSTVRTDYSIRNAGVVSLNHETYERHESMLGAKFRPFVCFVYFVVPNSVGEIGRKMR
ncbi:MAG: hypothetical protein AAF497_16505, partial [Planctomycetota bacterium]